MNIKSHLHIAKKIMEDNKDTVSLKYKKPFFYLGSILPDIIASHKFHPHFYEESSLFIYKKINKIKMTNKSSILNVIRAGIVIHYLCDFCCYAHIRGTLPNLKEHFHYEKKLWEYIQENKLCEDCIESYNKEYNLSNIEKDLDDEILIYRNGTPSYMWDITKSISISSSLYSSLFTPI